jgi:hypothetical protein
MAITTVDVVTNVVDGVETSKNATIVVSCLRTGEYNTIDSTYETSISYNSLEGTYTDRFQNTIDNLMASGAWV